MLSKWSGLKLDQTGFVLVFMHACLRSACWLHHSCMWAGCWNTEDSCWRDWRAGSRTCRSRASKADLGMKRCVIVGLKLWRNPSPDICSSWLPTRLISIVKVQFCSCSAWQNCTPPPAKFNSWCMGIVWLHPNSHDNSFIVWDKAKAIQFLGCIRNLRLLPFKRRN